MTAAERNQLRHAIDQETRRRLFTTDSRGKVILKSAYRAQIHRDNDRRIVPGIRHGTNWAYRYLKCGCDECLAAGRAVQARKRQQKVAA